MVSRQRRAKINKSIKLRKSLKSGRRNARFYDFLEKTISVKILLKYAGIILAFIIILVSVFMLGRISAKSADDDTGAGVKADNQQLTGKTTQLIKAGDAEKENIAGVEDNNSIDENRDDKSDSSDSEKASEEDVKYEEADDGDDGNDYEKTSSADEEDKEEISAGGCEIKTAGFDYAYTRVELGVSEIKKELRGENWASLTSINLTVKNNEDCVIINPSKIKVKLNPKGKGSVWWDDSVFLPESFKHVEPGETVSEVVPVHVSYSDISGEKEFRLALFDDYDVEINSFKEILVIA